MKVFRPLVIICYAKRISPVCINVMRIVYYVISSYRRACSIACLHFNVVFVDNAVQKVRAMRFLNRLYHRHLYRPDPEFSCTTNDLVHFSLKI